MNDKQEVKRYYYKNGKVEVEYYHLNGKKHRVDGPASIYYYEDGRVSSEFFYLEGRELIGEALEEFKYSIEFNREMRKLIGG
jgi:antitoxin component YwqK of YwqJK toxin-antitoxin module